MTIQDQRLNEISGMVGSIRQPGVQWVHNDSGDAPRLFAVGPDGETLAVLEISNATARDWEDLARFEIDGEPWLLIADVGDNNAVRHDTTLYLLPEPDLSTLANQTSLRLPATAIIRFRYEDGPRDCEGVAVDGPNRQILLISKRTEPPVLYTLPLKLNQDEDDAPLVAVRSTPLSAITPPTPAERALPGRLGQFRSQVTAFDISPDHRRAAVLTYGNVYLYRRDADQSWAEVFSGIPERLPVNGLPQSEALCFDEGGDTLLLTTEADQPPLLRYRLR